MMNCLRGRFKLFGASLLTVILAASCTEVDNSLGDNFIPDSQKMSLRIAVLGQEAAEPNYLDTYIAYQDSTPMNKVSTLFVGSNISPVFGLTSSSGIMQPVPYFYTKSDLGYKPAIDSLYIGLNILGCSNIHQETESFTIYKVTEQIVNDSTYYASFPAADKSDLSKPLFKFDLSTLETGYSLHKMNILPDGEEYLYSLINSDIEFSTKNSSYQNDSIFIDKFHGLYIAADNPQSGKGIFALSFAYVSSASSYPTMTIYMHNHKEDYTGDLTDEEATDTTVHKSYMIEDYSSSYPQTINSIQRNYPAQITAHLNDTLPTSMPVETAYIEGLGGIYTYLRVSEELVNKLNALKGDFAMSINNATIYFNVEGGVDPAVLNDSFTRLGMFYNYANFSSPIPDYDYNYEQTNSTTLPYGGYINRSAGGYYSMNISSYIQRLIDKPSSTPRVINLTPDVSQAYAFAQVPLKGSGKADYKIRLKLTYTLIPQ